jgi:tRNA (cytidine32/uridine32-2'-O)-methyltransferase
MLDNIQVTLSHTTHPGNIGAAARAMKTMGLSKLALVNPKDYPSGEATVRASRADDILQHAKVYSSVADAIEHCQLVVGTSARKRHLSIPLLTSRELTEKIASDHQGQQIALLFGTENSGLTNQELDYCHYHVYIPANPEYSSLNLAAAVQLISYELRMKFADAEQLTLPVAMEPPVSTETMNGFYEHLEQVLIETGYHNPSHPKHLMSRLRKLFNKAQPNNTEMQILRGILSSVQKTISKLKNA